MRSYGKLCGWRENCVGFIQYIKILSDIGSFLLPEHLKNDLTSLLSKNKKYKGHWKIISLANTTKIYKSGTWAKYIKRLCQLYFFKQNTPSAGPRGRPNRADVFGLIGRLKVWDWIYQTFVKSHFEARFWTEFSLFSSEEVIYQSCFLKSKKSQESEITILHFIFDQSIFISFTHYL